MQAVHHLQLYRTELALDAFLQVGDLVLVARTRPLVFGVAKAASADGEGGGHASRMPRPAAAATATLGQGSPPVLDMTST